MLDDEPFGRDDMGTPPPEPDTAGPKLAMPAWLDDLKKLGLGLKNLFAAQLDLAKAELGLAASGVVMMLFMGLAAIVFAVALGLTLLALAGWGLAQWFGSWAWALTALAGLQLVLLVVAILVFRRGMRWMTLPATRSELATLAKEAAKQGRAEGVLESIRKRHSDQG